MSIASLVSSTLTTPSRAEIYSMTSSLPPRHNRRGRQFSFHLATWSALWHFPSQSRLFVESIQRSVQYAWWAVSFALKRPVSSDHRSEIARFPLASLWFIRKMGVAFRGTQKIPLLSPLSGNKWLNFEWNRPPAAELIIIYLKRNFSLSRSMQLHIQRMQ